jgi:hypothetical protein
MSMDTRSVPANVPANVPQTVAINKQGTLVVSPYGAAHLEKSFSPIGDTFEVITSGGISNVKARVPRTPNAPLQTAMNINGMSFVPSSSETRLQFSINEKHAVTVRLANGCQHNIQPIAILPSGLLHGVCVGTEDEVFVDLRVVELVYEQPISLWRRAVADHAIFTLANFEPNARVLVSADINMSAAVSYQFSIEKVAGEKLTGSLHQQIAVTNNSKSDLSDESIKLLLNTPAQPVARANGLEGAARAARSMAPVAESDAGILTQEGASHFSMGSGPGRVELLPPNIKPAQMQQISRLTVDIPAHSGDRKSVV